MGDNSGGAVGTSGSPGRGAAPPSPPTAVFSLQFVGSSPPPPPQFCAPQAEAWLLARAQEEGWQRAERLRERRAKEGLLATLQREHCAVLVEVGLGVRRGGSEPLFCSF